MRARAIGVVYYHARDPVFNLVHILFKKCFVHLLRLIDRRSVCSRFTCQSVFCRFVCFCDLFQRVSAISYSTTFLLHPDFQLLKNCADGRPLRAIQSVPDITDTVSVLFQYSGQSLQCCSRILYPARIYMKLRHDITFPSCSEIESNILSVSIQNYKL